MASENIQSTSLLQNFIGGQFVQSISSAKPLSVINPATGETIAYVPLSDGKDVDSAVNAARACFDSKWSNTNVKTRIQKLMKLHSLILEKLDDLAAIVVQEHGKNVVEAKASILKGLETLEWAIGLPSSSHFTGRFLEVGTGVTCRDERVPVGVVASIIPFNFPIMVPFWTIPIALATGNCIILKPSEKVPLSLSFLAPLFKQAGFPDGAFQLVHGGKDVVEAICAHPDIQAVSFVGSSTVAEIVATQCQRVGKRVVALGGAKNHLVAALDCDVEVTAQDIVNSFTGCAGERCMAASVLLTIGENQALVDRIVELASQIHPGSASGEMGPVIDAAALQRIETYIQQTESTGAKVLLDGRVWEGRQKNVGFWIGPTIILHSNPTDQALQDEIFGPLLSIYSCNSPEEAIQIEKRSPYGNAAAIYTRSGLIAEWFTKRFSVGMVGVNIGIPVPREPFSFGGIGRSRFGMQLDITGEGGVDLFTYRRKVTTRWTESADSFFSSKL